MANLPGFLTEMGIEVEPIGMIGDGAEVTKAPLILTRGKEREVKIEDLVLVENLNGNWVLGVCRRGFGRSPGLRRDRYSPGRAYARMGMQPSEARESFDFTISIIGELTPNGIRQNKLIIAPRSRAYAFRKGSPLALLGGSLDIGYYKDHPSWVVPVRPEFIPYHMGVFCVTGWGKSSFVRCKIIPLLRHAGYGVLVFDWKGDDYVPYAEALGAEVLKLEQIACLPPDMGAVYIIKKANSFGFSAGSAILNNIEIALLEALEKITGQEEKGEEPQPKPFPTSGLTAEQIKTLLEEAALAKMKELIDKKYLELAERRFLARFKRLDARIFKLLTPAGKLKPEDVIEKARKGTVIIDLSGWEPEEKLTAFLSIASYVWQKMNVEKESINIAFVIDEAPQYCPYQPKGVQEQTTRMIEGLCALGRSYKLPIVIISQGLKGDIGINPAVRRNINTWFIGKVHPLDREEAQNMLPGVDIDFLQSLEVGHFYFYGNMCPSPVPLLIRFSIENCFKGQG
ncbi:hypothetical protein DRO60_00885 [Candidatus Bathyarchaeota archaeon]|nr:MAG: hypothetical protein DRO60_00885 [Candidatus Bathyarchaeota archaeon]